MQTVEIVAKRKRMDKLQGLVVIERSPRGRKLKQPILVELPKDLSPGERAVRKYVIDAFRWKMPTLIHFTFQNKSMLNLATHLYRHTTGSKQPSTNTPTAYTGSPKG